MHYTIKEQTAEQKRIYLDLLKNRYNSLVAYCLSLRNYNKAEKLIHYSKLTNIDLAAQYLANNILKNTPICIVADYDVDGATSCSIMYKGLKTLCADIQYFVPNRFKHGYGLQPSVIDDMLSVFPDIKTIVTVDNGIASIEGVEYAKKLGIEVIVTDHHLEGDKKPDALVIVNPNQKTCQFPSKALAGCGVAFYTIVALKDLLEKILNHHTEITGNNLIDQLSQENNSLFEQLSDEAKEYFKQEVLLFNPAILTDYLAIGTVADVVSLDENNQLLIELGLKRIHKGKASTSVQAILDTLNINHTKMNTIDIGFNIAPMLNAAGRLEDMSLGIQLLLEEDYNQAVQKTQALIELNEKRKNIGAGMRETALKQLEDFLQNTKLHENEDETVDNSNQLFAFCTYNQEYHEGVIGILASRIKDLLYVPTIVFTPLEEKEEGREVLKGSGRSIEQIHLRDAIDYVYKTVPDCILKFGGHSMAAGLTIYADKFNLFQKQLNKYCKKILNGQKPSKNTFIDKELDLTTIFLKDVDELKSQIWGQNFPEPIFIGNFKIIKQELSKNGAHLKLTLEQNGEQIEAMQFFHDTLYDGEKIRAIYKLNINEFRGNRKVQLFVEQAEII